MPVTWCDSARTLAGFVNLVDDWDGQGAIAPKPLLIIKAMSLLIELHAANELLPPFRIGACPMGGILFEWQAASGYLEAEITPDDAIEWMEEREGQPTRHGVGAPDGSIEWTKEPR